MDPAGNNQAPVLSLVDRDQATPRARKSPARRLGLSWLDQLAATAMAEGMATELSDLIELARCCAETLSGEEREESRVRLLAREVALAKVTLDFMTVAIGERLRANDERGARLADHLANSAARRLVALTAEHRVSCNAGVRPVVAIGHADFIRVDGGG